MAMNTVQFQKGLSLMAFLHQFGSESKCRKALYRSRWPKGFRCPCCQDRTHWRFHRAGQLYYQCSACRHQSTLLSGTLFEATKLPLTVWFLAIYLLTSSKTNLSALQLKRHLDVSYRTAWRLKHKVMEAMSEREKERKLKGSVQIDDAYLGGERNGGKVGRGSENKQAFLIAVQTDETLEHPRFAVIEPVKSFDNDAILDWERRRLMPEAKVYSDGLWAFRRFADTGHDHVVLEASSRRGSTEIKGARWVNVVLANVKRAISGTYHSIKQGKYARRYLAEAAYRFNRRFDLTHLMSRLIHAIHLCKPCPERVLRQASNFTG